MSHLRERMHEDLQLRGLAEKTQEAYLRAVRQLAEYYHKSPDEVSEEELRQYFLYLRNVKGVSPSTCTIALCGIKFFFEHTLQRGWPTLNFIRLPREKKLPVVLSFEEVHCVLGCLRRLRYRVCLSTIYACGLRLKEGVQLQMADIDSARMLVHVRQGKGAQDRYPVQPAGAGCSTPAARTGFTAPILVAAPPFALALSSPRHRGHRAAPGY